ncbi:MAG: chemotaxis protein CheW [Tissierellia bacterium]|nr:chemotaxis protein CheW [Tissierellia bacterium]
MTSNLHNKYVTFKLGKEYYGLPIDNVLSIEKPSKTTRIPNAPDYIIGLINLRGDVIPVIDLRVKLGMEKIGIDKDSRIIIVREKDIVVGLMVDSSKEVLDIDEENIDKPPESEDDTIVDYISGIGKKDERLVIILNSMRLLDIRSQ